MKKLIVLAALFIVLTSLKQKKELTWMAIGDSITYHNNHIGDTKGRVTKGYMDDVVEKLPYIHYANHGYPGWSVKGIADAFDKLGIVKADVYTVFLGTNDWWVNLPTGTFDDYKNNTGSATSYGAYRIIIDKIRALNSSAKIILITPLQRTDYVDANNQFSIIHGQYKPSNSGHMLSEYADVVKTIAKAENLELVDLYYKSGITMQNAVKYKRLKDPQTGEYKNYSYPEYIDKPFDPKTDEYPYPMDAMNFAYDGLHPTDKGHQKIADMLVKIMKKY